MELTLARNWTWIVFRGVVAIIFGVLTLRNPAITLTVLIMLFGAYALIDGLMMVIAAVSNRRGEEGWVALFFAGMCGILIGIGTFVMPAITATVLLVFIAVWAVVIGIAQIVAAIRLRKVITGEWMLAVAGVVSVLFGLILIARPAAGALAVVFWIGAYAVFYGIILIALGFRLRSWKRPLTPTGQPHAA